MLFIFLFLLKIEDSIQLYKRVSACFVYSVRFETLQETNPN